MVSNQLNLNQGQIDIVEILYKYRFSSRQLIADSLGIKAGSSLHERLQVLMKHGYIGMRLDKRLKLLGTPAAYYLTPKALKALQALPGHEYITDSLIKSSYKDKTVGQAFITHTRNVHKYTNLLKRQYPDTLKVFTRRELGQYDYFPKQLPDAFLSLKTNSPNRPKRFFLDFIPDAMDRYILDRRIASYCDFFRDGGWDITGSEYPTLLLISESGRAEKRVQRYVRARLVRSDMEELSVLTTTTRALEHTGDRGEVWTSITEPDELVGL